MKNKFIVFICLAIFAVGISSCVSTSKTGCPSHKGMAGY